MEHSGAISWSLNDDMEEAANSLVSCTGHLNPNDENTDTTCAQHRKNSGAKHSSLRLPTRTLCLIRQHDCVAHDVVMRLTPSHAHLEKVHSDAQHTEVHALVPGKTQQGHRDGCDTKHSA